MIFKINVILDQLDQNADRVSRSESTRLQPGVKIDLRTSRKHGNDGDGITRDKGLMGILISYGFRSWRYAAWSTKLWIACATMKTECWTNDFLNEMRSRSDSHCQLRIHGLLDPAALDGVQPKLTNWLNLQDECIGRLEKIAPSDSENGQPSAEISREIDSVHEREGMLYELLDFFDMRFWSRDCLFYLRNTRSAALMACKGLLHHRVDAALAAMRYARDNMVRFQYHFTKTQEKFVADPGARTKMVADNREAYNSFLNLIEDMRSAPEIFLARDSYRMEQFLAYPLSLTTGFQPAPAPPWVDANKLALGAAIWEKQNVACLLVLFLESLPACYLIKRGIPMLYATDRLTEQRFLSERIYETSFMLRDVMQSGGLIVQEAAAAIRLTWLAAAVHRVHPDWKLSFRRFLTPEWIDPAGVSHTRRALIALPQVQDEYRRLEAEGRLPDQFQPEELGIPNMEWLYRYCPHVAPDFPSLSQSDTPPNSYSYYPGRFLWGSGFITARMVRFLHASIRYYAKHTTPPYDTQENGEPINQEDLAFVLLTFGYLIPRGLEKLGAIVSREEKEAFLHSWKLVGHLMGIDSPLLTEDLDEAGVLYEKIKKRQQAPSERGIALTNALCVFFQDLLPIWLPMRGKIAPVLMRAQFGGDVNDLFDAKTDAASRNIPLRVLWWLQKNVSCRIYFLSCWVLFNRTPFTRAYTNEVLHFFGNAMITSWRQPFKRKALDLTQGEKGFTEDPGVTVADFEKQAAFRRQVFLISMMGLGLIMVFHVCFWLALAGGVVWGLFPATSSVAAIGKSAFIVGAMLCALELIGVWIAELRVQACVQSRPFTEQRLG